MDNTEIHDTRLQNRNNNAILGYLAKKSNNPLGKRTQSIETSISIQSASKLPPKYSFTIINYKIGEHV